MEVFKRFFKRAFVFGVFAQPIIYFAYAFLNLCPFQRFTPFGYDFCWFLKQEIARPEISSLLVSDPSKESM